jgi:hypothetical protein
VISTGHHRSSIGTIGRASANEPTAGHVGSARSAQTSTPPPDASRRRTAFHPKRPLESRPRWSRPDNDPKSYSWYHRLVPACAVEVQRGKAGQGRAQCGRNQARRWDDWWWHALDPCRLDDAMLRGSMKACDTGSRTGSPREARADSQPQPSRPSERPVDSAAGHGDTRNVAADTLFEGGLPGHEAESEPVIDHGEPAAG